MQHPNDSIIPLGLCQCGCGERTTISTQNHRRFGWVKGQPMRFIRGHSRRTRGPDYIEDPETGCWNWQKRLNAEQAGKQSGGYGQIWNDARKSFDAAHKVYWQRVNGSIPAGHELHHTCWNRRCVNPSHLVALTPTEHMRLHPHVVLDMEKAREVRRLHAAGTPTKVIAAQFGISVSSVRHVYTGRHWQEPTEGE